MRKPAQTWREKGIDIAAWESNNGYTFTFRKSYKDKQTSEWKESRYYYLDELELLALLLVHAISWAEEAKSDKQSTLATIANAPQPKAKDLDDDIPF